MFIIQVKDATDDQIIGHITTQELKKYMKASRTEFVPETVKRFNEMKEDRGEPERARMVFE